MPQASGAPAPTAAVAARDAGRTLASTGRIAQQTRPQRERHARSQVSVAASRGMTMRAERRWAAGSMGFSDLKLPCRSADDEG
jgi:hypothetical protein